MGRKKNKFTGHGLMITGFTLGAASAGVFIVAMRISPLLVLYANENISVFGSLFSLSLLLSVFAVLLSVYSAYRKSKLYNIPRVFWMDLISVSIAFVSFFANFLMITTGGR